MRHAASHYPLPPIADDTLQATVASYKPVSGQSVNSGRSLDTSPFIRTDLARQISENFHSFRLLTSTSRGTFGSLIACPASSRRLWGTGTGKSQLLHLVDQSGALQSKFRGGAFRAADDPTNFFERAQNQGAFGVP
jgi:hypothetical protein